MEVLITKETLLTVTILLAIALNSILRGEAGWYR